MTTADELIKLLIKLPAYTPIPTVLIGSASESGSTALFFRTDSLASFNGESMRLQLSFTGYEHASSHVACLAFRVFNGETAPLEGEVYLNPRQRADRLALEYLTRQERFLFVFMSADLKSKIMRAVPWQQKSRDSAREVFERSISVGLIEGSFDPEFHRAKEQFQSRYSVTNLFAE